MFVKRGSNGFVHDDCIKYLQLFTVLGLLHKVMTMTSASACY